MNGILSEKNRYIKYLFGIVMGLSSAMFAVQQIVVCSGSFILITGIVAFIIGFLTVVKAYDGFLEFVNKKRVSSVFLLVISAVIAYEAYTQKVAYQSSFSEICMRVGLPEVLIPFINVFRLRYFIVSVPAIWCLLVIVINYAKYILGDVFKDMSDKEKRGFMTISLLCAILVLLEYMAVPMWYRGGNTVYGMDSGQCMDIVFPVFSYAEIRHPLFGIFTFPVWVVIEFFLKLFVPQNLVAPLTAELFRGFNAQLLLIMGIIIGKLTGDKFIFYLYLFSFPTLLFIFAFEKYHICIFLFVLYVYSKCRKRKGSGMLLALATGAMPTNAFLGITEFFGNGSLKEKGENILGIIITSILTFICFGRIHLLIP